MTVHFNFRIGISHGYSSFQVNLNQQQQDFRPDRSFPNVTLA